MKATPSNKDLESATLIPSGAEPIIAIRYVVGEVRPVFDDALALRAKVFTDAPPPRKHQQQQQKQQTATEEGERDAWESLALHFVAYLDVTATRHYHDVQQKRKQMLAVIHGGGAASNKQHNSNSNNNNNKRTTQKLEAKTQHNIKFSTHSPEEADRLRGRPYRARQLVPVGTARLRRVNRTEELGDFTMMVAQLDCLCVLQNFREYKIGALLVEEAELVARHAFHVPFVVVHSHLSTKGFYKKLGYEVKTDTFGEGSNERVGMVKSLLTNKGSSSNKKEADDCVVLDAKGGSKTLTQKNKINYSANQNDKPSRSTTTPSKL